MADSGTGIQELMAAETRASQIVAEARIGTYYNESICNAEHGACVSLRSDIFVCFNFWVTDNVLPILNIYDRPW